MGNTYVILYVYAEPEQVDLYQTLYCPTDAHKL